MSDFIPLLIKTLRLLTRSADEQVCYLVNLGIKGNVDELALEYDDVMRLAQDQLDLGQITRFQYDSMQRLDQQLDEMSSSDKAYLWTEKALYDAREWSEVRKMAIERLSLFDADRGVT
ncbi:MAG: hypothetical protein MI924_25390 [Chloroflexales bacterium]|nr:hypothetical protein [Chloroflexales bacterium]